MGLDIPDNIFYNETTQGSGQVAPPFPLSESPRTVQAGRGGGVNTPGSANLKGNCVGNAGAPVTAQGNLMFPLRENGASLFQTEVVP